MYMVYVCISKYYKKYFLCDSLKKICPQNILIHKWIRIIRIFIFSLLAANILYIQVCSYCLTDTGSRATLLYENDIFLYNDKSEIYSYWALHKN